MDKYINGRIVRWMDEYKKSEQHGWIDRQFAWINEQIDPLIKLPLKVVTCILLLQEFESELTDRQSQLSLATARARLLTENFTTPNSFIENMDGEEIKKYFDSLENSLYKIRKSADKWKSDVEAVFSAMDEFQVRF